MIRRFCLNTAACRPVARQSKFDDDASGPAGSAAAGILAPPESEAISWLFAGGGKGPSEGSGLRPSRAGAWKFG
jgi:hypothetical protein